MNGVVSFPTNRYTPLIICCLSFRFGILWLSFGLVKPVRASSREACWRARCLPLLGGLLSAPEKRAVLCRQARRGCVSSLGEETWGCCLSLFGPRRAPGGAPPAPKHACGCVPTPGHAPPASPALRKVRLIHPGFIRGRVLPSPALGASLLHLPCATSRP